MAGMSQGRSQLRVIGGIEANENEYPFVVRLQNLLTLFKRNLTLRIHVCTASVICPTWTVTAAHCVSWPETTESYNLKPYIIAGTVTNAWTKEAAKFIQNFFVHPGYKLELFTVRNDIALIKSETITLSQYGRISAIDVTTLIGLKVTSTGYGITNDSFFVGDATALGKPLQMLDVLVVKCSTAMQQRIVPRLCVARRCEHSAGLCPGDSGGPLLHTSGIIGVNTAGPQNLKKLCALEPTAPIYDVGIITPINPFIDWIESIIK